MKKFNMRRISPILVSGIALMLAGCQYDMDDPYEPVSVQERYPIRVVDGTAKTGIKAPHGSLTTDQVNAVSNFATEARRASSSRVTIKYPSGSSSSRLGFPGSTRAPRPNGSAVMPTGCATVMPRSAASACCGFTPGICRSSTGVRLVLHELSSRRVRHVRRIKLGENNTEGLKREDAGHKCGPPVCVMLM